MNRQLATPFTPELYQQGGAGRYRRYPRQVQTPIPGAGYDVGQMVWGEQELNLNGSSQPQHYGDYEQVPLRGLGAPLLNLNLSPTMLRAVTQRSVTLSVPGAGDQGGPGAPETSPEDIVETVYEVPTAPPPVPEQDGFFARKVGPVPVWALGAGGLALLAGGVGWWWMRR